MDGQKNRYKMAHLMKIGEVAARFGVTTRTLRHYEEKGLIKPAKSPKGTRHFDSEQQDRIEKIQQLVCEGVKLEAIRDRLGALDIPDSAGPAPVPGEALLEDRKKLGLTKIGEVADRLNTTVRTLRFYEELGFVTPKRTPKGTRVYSEDDVALFDAALGVSALGLKLEELRDLSRRRESSATGSEASGKVLPELERLRHLVRDRITEYLDLEREIERADMLVRQCENCKNKPSRKGCPTCPMEQNLDRSRLVRLIWDADRG